MNAQVTRVDVELRLCGFPETSTAFFEFRAMNSFGQEFIGDEMGLRCMGEQRMKLCYTKELDALDVLRRMLVDGLNVKQINTELVP